MSILNRKRVTVLDMAMVAAFLFLLLNLVEQPQIEEVPLTLVSTEEFVSTVQVRTVTASRGDSLYSFCEDFPGEELRHCIRYIVFNNRDLFPATLDSEDDFYIIAGDSYVIPHK